MTTAYPAALDAFTNPAANQSQSASSPRTHSQMHGDAFDAIEALQAKVGIDSAVAGASPRSIEARFGDIVNVKDYGAEADADIDPDTGEVTAGTDQTAAFQAAIDHLKSLGGGTLYVPAGSPGMAYWFAYAAGDSPDYTGPGALNIDGGNIRIRGDGMDSTILAMETSAGPDFENPYKLFWRDVADPSSATDPWGPVAFCDLQFRGLFGQTGYVALGDDPGSFTQPNDQVMLLMNLSEIRFERVRFKNIVNFAMLLELVDKLVVVDCDFDTVARDSIHARNVRNCLISRNRFIHSDDNPIAIGQTESREDAGENGEVVIITDNSFEDTPSVSVSAARQTIIANNVWRRCNGGLNIVQFAQAPGNGTLDSQNFSVSIVNNQFLDTVRRSWEVDKSAFVSVISVHGTAMATTGGIVPGFVNRATGLTVLPYAYRNVRSPSGGAYYYRIAGNLIGRTLPAVGAWSTWGFGERFFPKGFGDPAVTEAELRPTIGIHLLFGIRNFYVGENIIDCVRDGITLAPTMDNQFTGGLIARNQISNCIDPADATGANGILIDAAAGYSMDVTLDGNIIDMDPYYLSPRRDVFGSGRAPTWDSTLTKPSAALNLNRANGAVVMNTQVKNCSYAVVDQSDKNRYSNTIYHADIRAGGGVVRGVGSLITDRETDRQLVQWNLDFASADFGKALEQSLVSSNGVPTTGYYLAGHFVRNTDQTVSNMGWWRMTTGNGHVLATDWLAI